MDIENTVDNTLIQRNSYRAKLEGAVEDKFLNEVVQFDYIVQVQGYIEETHEITGKVDSLAVETKDGIYIVITQLNNKRYQLPLFYFLQTVKILKYETANTNTEATADWS